MAKAIKKFRFWLANQRNFLFNKYTKDARETQEPERSLVELPPDIKIELIDLVNDLPRQSPPTNRRSPLPWMKNMLVGATILRMPIIQS